MKKIVTKFTKVLLLTAMIFSNLMTPISVLANTNNSQEPIRGDLGVNGVKSDKAIVSTPGYSTPENNGEVQVIKTVSKVSGQENRYNVEFTVKGEKIETLKQKDIYVVLVFDTSNSMICGDGFVREGNLNDHHYKMDDGTYIKCSRNGYGDYDDSLLTRSKWENAVNAAVHFATEFAKIDNQYLSLVNFGGRAMTATDFVSKKELEQNETSLLEKDDFHYVSDGTNMEAALKEAERKLDEIHDDEAQKYILMIGDGMPTAKDSYYLSAVDATKKIANDIKLLGIEIFTIGYGLDSTTDTHEVLQYVSSDYVVRDENGNKITPTYQNLGYHTSASIDTNASNNIDNILTMMLRKLGELKYAGPSATVTDYIGDNFKIVDGDSLSDARSIELSFGEITPEGETKSFVVEIIDNGLSTGWYDVNKGFEVNYVNHNNEDPQGPEIVYPETANQPQVYWEANNYKINYYKDSKTTTNKIESEEGYAPNNTVIDTDDFDELKYLPDAGYELLPQNITPSSITVTNDGTVKEIDIVYTKINYNYVVNYYYDNVQDTTLTKNLTAPYNTQIDSKTYYQYNTRQGYVIDSEKSDDEVFTITEDGIVIDVYFKKAEYKYDVNYYFDGLEEKSLYKNPAAIYGSTIFATNHYLTNTQLNSVNKGNYFIDPNNSSNTEEIEILTPNEELNIYYISTKTSNEKVEKTSTTTEITNSKTPVDYKIEYQVDITNIEAGSTITTTIVDKLPDYEIDLEDVIDPEKSDLAGGVYDETTNTITWTITETVTNFTDSKPITIEINYSIVYEDFADISASQNNKLINGVETTTQIKNVVSEGDDGSSEIPVNIEGLLEVIYESEDGTLLEKLPTTTKPVGTTYQTEQKTFYGYSFKEVEGNATGTYIEGTTTVKYIYTKNKGNVTKNDVTKEGPTTIDSIDKPFDYILKYEGVIEEYTGKVTLTLTDKLPNNVKEIASIDNRCTYSATTNTMTCTDDYNIDEDTKTINDTFTISVKFSDITTNTVTNEVNSVLEYGNEDVEDSGSTTTTIYEGSLEVIYESEDKTLLEKLPTTTKTAGTDYETVKKDFYGYTFKKVENDNAKGEYLANQTVTVKYIYTKNEGKITKNDVTKEGLANVGSINDKFDYVLKYEGIIEEYTGKVTLTLTDKLPNNVKEIVSIDNRCTYDETTNTLTCKEEYDIDIGHTTITDSFEFSVKYDKILNSTVVNEVNSLLEYGKKEVEDSGETKTEVKTGNVNVYYVIKVGDEYIPLSDYAKDDEDNLLPGFENVDLDDVTLTGMIDDTFETTEREINGYKFNGLYTGNLAKDSSNLNKLEKTTTKGIYTEETQEFTYVFDVETGTGSDIPPKTGVEAPINNMVTYINYLLLLLAGLILKKRMN